VVDLTGKPGARGEQGREEGDGRDEFARAPASRERSGAKEGGGEEQEQGGRGVAEVLEARGGVERGKGKGGVGAEQERDREGAALFVEAGEEAEEGDDPGKERSAKRRAPSAEPRAWTRRAAMFLMSSAATSRGVR